MTTISDRVDQILQQLGAGSPSGGGSVDLTPIIDRLDALGPMVKQLQADVGQIKTDLEGGAGGAAPPPSPPPVGAAGAPTAAPVGPPTDTAPGATAGGMATEATSPPGAGPSPAAAGVITGSPAATGGP